LREVAQPVAGALLELPGRSAPMDAIELLGLAL
jgi:hypothetical protein